MGLTDDNCTFSLEKRVNFSQYLQETFHVTERHYPAWIARETVVGLSVAWAIIGLVGLVASALVLWWICSGKKKRSSVDAYIVSLTAIDLLTILIKPVKEIVLLQINGNWASLPESVADILCPSSAYVEGVLHSMSFLLLIIIAIDRYIAICHPIFHYKRASRKYLSVIFANIIAWIISLLIPIGDVIKTRLSYPPYMAERYEEFHYQNPNQFITMEFRCVRDEEYYKRYGTLICAADLETCQDFKMYRYCRLSDDNLTLIMFLLLYVLPWMVMTYCYARIIHRLWIRKPIGDILANPQNHANIRRDTMHNTVTMITLCVVFGALWLPFWIYTFYESELPIKYIIPVDMTVFQSVSRLATMFSIISTPIIYMCLDKNFRKLIKHRLGIPMYKEQFKSTLVEAPLVESK